MHTREEPRHYTQLRCASNRLPAALQREHPHIIAHLKGINPTKSMTHV